MEPFMIPALQVTLLLRAPGASGCGGSPPFWPGSPAFHPQPPETSREGSPRTSRFLPSRIAYVQVLTDGAGLSAARPSPYPSEPSWCPQQASRSRAPGCWSSLTTRWTTCCRNLRPPAPSSAPEGRPCSGRRTSAFLLHLLSVPPHRTAWGRRSFFVGIDRSEKTPLGERCLDLAASLLQEGSSSCLARPPSEPAREGMGKRGGRLGSRPRVVNPVFFWKEPGDSHVSHCCYRHCKA